MPTEIAIACSLTPSQMDGRLAEMAAIGEAALLSSASTGTQAVLRFRADDDVSARLARVVAAEAQCCRFLDMQLHDETGAVALTITAPAGAEPVLADLVAAFANRQPA